VEETGVPGEKLLTSLVYPTNKTDRYAITEILLKVALNTITITP
jgi:hypothetical protein